MLEKVHRIQGAGIEVWCGMIVGFDNDGPSVFDAQARFLEESRIANVLVSLLTAIPKTPLYHRLEREGRLDLSDELEFGTNVISLQLSREELRDGYVRVMNELYEPDAYFGRLEELYLREKIQFCQGRARYWRRHPIGRLTANAWFLAQATGLFLQLMRKIPEASLRREYRRRIGRFLKARRDPATLLSFVFSCAMHYHAHSMARRMVSGRTAVFSGY